MPTSEKGQFREMEFDVIAQSTDRKALLVREYKWTNPEIAVEVYRKLMEKVTLLPVAQGKKVVPVLFLKNTPKDVPENINILYPQDIINARFPEY